MLVYTRCGIERERERRERGGVERGLGGQRRISGSAFFKFLLLSFFLCLYKQPNTIVKIILALLVPWSHTSLGIPDMNIAMCL